MKKLENLKSRVAIIIVILLLLALLTTGLLFAYKPDLFTNHNRSVLSLDLNHRNFDIPLNHKYKFYTPTSHTIETENTIEEITEKFTAILNTKETIIVKKIGDITFLNVHINEKFAQTISIFPQKIEKKDYITVRAEEFVPFPIFDNFFNSSDGKSLLYKKDLVDGEEYTLSMPRHEKVYDNAMDMLKEYYESIYEVKSYENGRLIMVVDNKTIVLKQQ